MFHLTRRWPERALATALLGSSLVLSGGGSPVAGDCTNLGGRVMCGGRVAHTQVGSTLFFPQGPAARRSGQFVQVTPGALPQVLLLDGIGSEAPGPRPLNRPDALTGPTKGRDFGAFEFPSGTGSPLASLPRG